MYVLGIETSCDETSVAIVKDGRKVIVNAVSSSLKLHRKHGGIIPEIASRAQLETIAAVAGLAVKEAGLKKSRLDLISVTSGPGLAGSLLTGISFAGAVSLSLGIPLLGVNHVHSHIYANFLNGTGVKLPFVALVASGGHTSLFLVKDFDDIQTLGQTLDDACGEAFDKVAKILGMGYPGGPFIEKRARNGDGRKIKFSCSGTNKPLDFSFSGIKTAVLYYAKAHSSQLIPRLRSGQAAHNSSLGFARDRQLTADICASFQESAIDSLVNKSLLACELKKINRLVIGGGVAANNRLREKFLDASGEKGVNCYFPEKYFCTDNAAMVAGLGFQLFKKGLSSGLNLTMRLN